MTKVKHSSLKQISDTILSYYPDAKLELVEKAYRFAEDAHRGQLRSSGEP